MPRFLKGIKRQTSSDFQWKRKGSVFAQKKHRKVNVRQKKQEKEALLNQIHNGLTLCEERMKATLVLHAVPLVFALLHSLVRQEEVGGGGRRNRDR